MTKTGGQVVVVWGFALGLLPMAAARLDEQLGWRRLSAPWSARLGLITFAVGSGFGLAAARVMVLEGRGTPLPMDAARHLVVAGPYAIVRNPMAVSAILQSAGVALMRGSRTAALIPVAGGIVWQLAIRPSEERFLASTFGDDYAAYGAAVRCWLPTWPPYRTRSAIAD